MSHVIEEVDGGFVLPIAGFVCSEARDGGELILRSADSADEAWVSGSQVGEDLIRQLVEREAHVVGAGVARDSTLRITFDDGSSIESPAAVEVEAWEVRGPGYVVAIAVPGGGEPALWDATSERRIVHPGDPLPSQVKTMCEAYGLLPTGDFEFRLTMGRREAIELHPPNAPELNRSDMIRFVLPSERPSEPNVPWWRRRRASEGEAT